MEADARRADPASDGVKTSPTVIFSGDPEIRRCPFDKWDELRELPGLYYEPQIEAFVAVRHADVMQVIRDPLVFSSKTPFGAAAARRDRAVLEPLMSDPKIVELIAALKPRRTPVLVNCDPPVHQRQRRLVQASFAGQRITAAEPMVERITTELLDAINTSEAVDIVSAFSVPLPVYVIAKMLGADDEHRVHFKRWSDDFMRAAGNEKLDPKLFVAAMQGNAELYAYLRTLMDERRTNPRDDLITAIMEARRPGDEPLTDNELLSMFLQFLVAGNETTTALIGSSLLALAQRPELADRLRSECDKIPLLVEEILRRESPIQGSFRIATRDTDVNGVHIKAGEQVFMLFAAANRDASVYGDAEIDIDAKRPPHMAFGFGEHFCLGSSLARMEAKLAITAFLKRFDHFELAGDAQPVFAPTYMVRSLVSLPLKLCPAKAVA